MPKERYGTLEYEILEYLYNSNSIHNSLTDIESWLGKSIPSYTVDKMIKKNLIYEKRVLNFRAIRLRTKGKKIFESRFKDIKSPIKRIDISDAYYSNRFRNPKGFVRIRIARGTNIKKDTFLGKIGYKANQISKNSQVKMGLTKSGKWKVQAIRITIDKDFDKNQELAIRIYNEIENWLKK